jgi:hypothetical protein
MFLDLPDPDPLVRGMDPMIRIRTKMLRIPKTGLNPSSATFIRPKAAMESFKQASMTLGNFVECVIVLVLEGGKNVKKQLSARKPMETLFKSP